MFRINKKLIYTVVAVTFCFSLSFSPVNKSYAKDLEKTKITEDVKNEKHNKKNDTVFHTNKIKFTATTSSGKALNSGVWVIKDKNNNVIDTFKVSKNSYIFTKTLPNGEFLFEQKTPPKGYLKDNKVVTIKTPIPVKNKGDVFEIYPKTTKETPTESKETPGESTEIYKTGGIDFKYLLGAIALIFPIVFLIVNSNKKKVGGK